MGAPLTQTAADDVILSPAEIERITALTRDLETSLEAAENIKALQVGSRDAKDLARRLNRCLIATRRRAQERALPFTIDWPYTLAIAQRQQWRCALTGLALVASRPAGKAEAMAPSIDRIIPARGYVPGNVRILCVAMNYALNAFGEEFFERIAASFLKHREGPCLEIPLSAA